VSWQADLPLDGILALAQHLIRTPSQGGIDAPAAVLEAGAAAMTALGLPARLLAGADGQPLALMAEITGGSPGPTWVLNACIDTAPAGDRSAWSVDPFAGIIADGWLWGRGAADSKIAVAGFCHLAARLAADRHKWHGSLILLFDADEHTGRFGGIRRFVQERPDVAGVMVGYPENEIVNIGARGFWRAKITTYGQAQHSGSLQPRRQNAAVKLARLIAALDAAPLPPAPIDDPFPLGPQLTVTAVEGGSGFSMVPGAASLLLDVRLTPAFQARAAVRLVESIVTVIDGAMPTARPSLIEPLESWGAYRLPNDSLLGSALVAGARQATGRPVPGEVCGPSNIGNFLADLGIPATCGFGVTCHGIHGADERIEIASVPLVWNAYGFALERLLKV
jgi:succinyl-diaminopimelate desuccinylase